MQGVNDLAFCCQGVPALLKRVKDGKTHHYYSVVENRRLQAGKVAQRQALYLGEIND